MSSMAWAREDPHQGTGNPRVKARMQLAHCRAPSQPGKAESKKMKSNISAFSFPFSAFPRSPCSRSHYSHQQTGYQHH